MIVLHIFENGKEEEVNVFCRRECRQLQSQKRNTKLLDAREGEVEQQLGPFNNFVYIEKINKSWPFNSY